eukprot:GSMAST32.ASY1.ANO1.2519.1 assembled CDS
MFYFFLNFNFFFIRNFIPNNFFRFFLKYFSKNTCTRRMPVELASKLRQQLNELACKQHPWGIDYHPHSNNIVVDIVHPALYCYVKNETQTNAKSQSLPQSKTDERQYDSWGRPYETSRYQWLPTEFFIIDDGRVSIDGYINNLVPRETYEQLYKNLQNLFSHCIPLIEAVYSYGCAVREQLRSEEDEMDFNDSKPEPIHPSHCSLHGRQLQVITKIVDYELSPGQSYEGVWHVEGMSHEEIVATVIWVAERDDDLEGGDLLFKRAFLKNEAEFIFSTVASDRHSVLNDIIDEGLVPLGRITTPRGRLLCFPNITRLLNKNKENDDATSEKARRRIVVFFIINPDKRIVSTADISPQQKVAGGHMSRNEALDNRLKLMQERKYAKQDWNVREIELCEH